MSLAGQKYEEPFCRILKVTDLARMTCFRSISGERFFTKKKMNKMTLEISFPHLSVHTGLFGENVNICFFHLSSCIWLHVYLNICTLKC